MTIKYLCPACFGNGKEIVLTADEGKRIFTCPECGQEIKYNDLAGLYDKLMQTKMAEIDQYSEDMEEAREELHDIDQAGENAEELVQAKQEAIAQMQAAQNKAIVQRLQISKLLTKSYGLYCDEENSSN